MSPLKNSMNFIYSRLKDLFRQIWFWFLLLITFNQIAILVAYYFFIMQPTVSSLTTVLMGLADAVERQRSPNDARGLDVLSDRWISKDNIMVVSGLPKDLGPRPPYPGFQIIENKIHAGWGDRVRIGYTSNPDRVLWLMFVDEEKPFSVGIPFSDRLQTMVAMLLVIGLIFLLTIFTAWFISSRLNRPLRELSLAARKLGKGDGIDEIKFIRSAPPDVIALAKSFKEMKNEIDQMQAERERFLAGIAHDLRTPLSRMRVAVEFPEISKSSFADGLQEDIEEMRIILDQFLELSRLDSEKSEPFIVQDIAQLVTEVVNKYLRANAPISVLIQSTAMVKFKPIALTRLLYNLIDNALRHGVGGVRVEVGSDAEFVWISVVNDANTHAEESALISALRWVGGRQQSGLGSAIVHRISDVHGAQLIVNPENSEVFEVSIQFKIAS